MCACSLLLPVTSLAAQEPTAEWLRSVEEPATRADGVNPDIVRLEIAVRRYASPERPGEEIVLVGVAHIGDAAYYDALEQLLGQCDIVLFESVAPAGAKGVSGTNDLERAEQTRAAMEFIGSALARQHARSGAIPATLDALASGTGEMDSRMPEWVRAASVDGWSTPLELVHIPPAPSVEGEPAPRARWQLVSLGADRAPGGEGAAEDIIISSPEGRAMPGGGRGIQAEVADALGLAFQLEAIDYAHDGWILADMTTPELQDAARLREVDVAPLMEGLSGASLPARLGKTMLLLLRVADFLSGNQARDMMKVLMVEVLANPRALELAQQQGGPLGEMNGLMELILVARNEVALEQLDEVLEQASGRIALFYGAAHMDGLEEGLEERGYVETGETTWLPAIEVDLAGSNVDPRTMELLRRRIHDALGTGMRGRPSNETGDRP